MTNRERDIFKIIESNPFISQNEIAEKLNISRSAVSVYLNMMYKKGIIKGRGYIIGEETYPVLIGPSHIDIRSVCVPPSVNRVFLNAKTQITHGGPVKNTAECLIGLGIFPKAIFAIASDNFGTSFLDSCERAGIDVDGSIIVSNASSPVYVEMVDEKRRIIAASFATDNLSSYITPNHLHAQFALLKNASTIVAHDSLPPESAAYLQCFKSKADLLLVSSDIEYTEHISESFHAFDAVILPYYIVSELLNGVGGNAQYTSAEELCALARELGQRGIGDFYLFLDDSRLCYCDEKRLLLHTSQNPDSKNETAYLSYMKFRDIFAAIVAYCLENSIDPVQALDLAASARNIVCGSDSYFSPKITLSLLRDEAERLHPQLVSCCLEPKGKGKTGPKTAGA